MIAGGADPHVVGEGGGRELLVPQLVLAPRADRHPAPGPATALAPSTRPAPPCSRSPGSMASTRR
eukprot:3250498-Prorocentrum_lima.AAC.1